MIRNAAAGSMNHSATQLRLTRNRAHSDGVSAPADGTGIDVWTVLILLPTPNRWDDAWPLAFAPSVVPISKKNPARACRAGSLSAEDALGGTFRRSHRGLHILTAGAVVREHVDDHEVGDRGGCIFTHLANARRRQRRGGDVTVRRVLRVGGPDRIFVVPFKEVRKVALGCLDPR